MFALLSAPEDLRVSDGAASRAVEHGGKPLRLFSAGLGRGLAVALVGILRFFNGFFVIL